MCLGWGVKKEGSADDGYFLKKSCIRETSNLSTDADRRTDTILERLRDLSIKEEEENKLLDNFIFYFFFR